MHGSWCAVLNPGSYVTNITDLRPNAYLGTIWQPPLARSPVGGSVRPSPRGLGPGTAVPGNGKGDWFLLIFRDLQENGHLHIRKGTVELLTATVGQPFLVSISTADRSDSSGFSAGPTVTCSIGKLSAARSNSRYGLIALTLCRNRTGGRSTAGRTNWTILHSSSSRNAEFLN